MDVIHSYTGKGKKRRENTFGIGRGEGDGEEEAGKEEKSCLNIWKTNKTTQALKTVESRILAGDSYSI